MSRVGAGEDRATPPSAAQVRAAVETYARNEESLRRTARRFSLCEDDADEALQRALEILLQKAPSEDPRELIRWTQTVVRHEALALRRDRERILSGPAALAPEPGREDWTAQIPSDSAGPAERAEEAERVARTREALSTLKPPELRALSLLAEGYSYAEIGEITGFSHTKINRSLAEGRERFRRFLDKSARGRRCAELAPLLSAFCDGEAGADEDAVREHLRACPHCRATLHSYRAAPRAAAALAPTLPLGRSLADRAHDAVAGLAARIAGGGSGEATVSGVATAGGTRGAGLAALAKVAAICVGTAGGAAACVATGVVPVPATLSPSHTQVEAAHVSKPLDAKAKRRYLSETAPEYETEVEVEPAPSTQSEPEPQPKHEPKPDPEPESVSEAASPAEAESATASGAVEYAPPPAPAAAPPASESSSSSSSSGGGNPAGEFGP